MRLSAGCHNRVTDTSLEELLVEAIPRPPGDDDDAASVPASAGVPVIWLDG